MIEYRATVFVGMQDHTWHEQECVYLADADEGDARALEAMEQQVLNSMPQNAPVAFVLASPTTLEVTGEEDAEDLMNFTYWIKIVRRLCKEQGKTFEDGTAIVAFTKDYTPSGFVNAFAYYPDDEEES